MQVLGSDIPENKIRLQNGFKGMRRREMLDFAKPFIARGKIPAIDENTPKDKLLPMMESWMAQGYFGEDPFGIRRDRNAAMDAVIARQDRLESKLDRLTNTLERVLSERASPEAPPDDGAEETDEDGDGALPPTTPGYNPFLRPTPVDVSALDWPELKRLAQLAGVEDVKKKRRDQLEPIVQAAFDKARQG